MKRLNFLIAFLLMFMISCTVTEVHTQQRRYVYVPAPMIYNGHYFQYYYPGTHSIPHYHPAPIRPPHHHHHGPRRR